jgi:outer membrane receptor for ferrienterochelin and colicins
VSWKSSPPTKTLTSKLVAAALLLLLGSGAAASAQDAPRKTPRKTCADVLREAERSYRSGRVEAVLAVRPACLEGEATPRQRVEAYLLLAKRHLAEGEAEEAIAVVEILIGLDPELNSGATGSAELGRLVSAEKDRRAIAMVATVSKVDEPLREAPATVIVVTAAEIERRGYLDLEEVLHDLPGFDISRGNGDVYSNVYLRGYRSDRSDRMLFLIDGVEQNDLHSNTVYLSRQIPLSNVETLEVVYGPASTIYGANAFTGVVSVTTKAPTAFLTPGRNLGATVQVGGGSFATRLLDVTLAGRTPNGRLSWSLTGRSFRSDEPNLSAFPDWDYDPAALDELDYESLMRLDGALGKALVDVCAALASAGLGCEVLTDENGEAFGVGPTAADAEKARELDKALFAALEDRPTSFSDPSDDWAIDAKVRLGELTFGVRSWRRAEGTTPWYTDQLRAGTGNVQVPRQSNVYARYSHPLGNHLKLNLLARYKQHELDAGSSSSRFVTFAGKALNIIDLAAFFFPGFQKITFDQKSSQLRNELTLLYQPSGKFSLVSGIEVRNSSVQLDFGSAVEEQVQSEDFQIDATFFATQVGTASTETTDLGLFAQASYKLRESFKVVVGGRFDTGDVRGTQRFLTYDEQPTSGNLDRLRLEDVAIEGSESVFNPRLALVYTRGDFVLKTIYAEAFQQPSSFQKFTREPGVRDFVSPELKSEKVKNVELSLSWQPRKDRHVEIDLYQASYSNAVALKSKINDAVVENPFAAFTVFPITSGRFENTGGLRVRGVQIHARGRFASIDLFGLDLFANYTYTEPVSTEPTDEVGEPLPDVHRQRIGDIASHRLNLGAGLALGERWHFDLRTSWVGDRPTGSSTTAVDNPFEKIDSYFVANTAVSWQGWPAGVTWQLVIRNLLDSDYDHPGVQRGGAGFASRLPQPGRGVYLRLVYER